MLTYPSLLSPRGSWSRPAAGVDIPSERRPDRRRPTEGSDTWADPSGSTVPDSSTPPSRWARVIQGGMSRVSSKLVAWTIIDGLCTCVRVARHSWGVLGWHAGSRGGTLRRTPGRSCPSRQQECLRDRVVAPGPGPASWPSSLMAASLRRHESGTMCTCQRVMRRKLGSWGVVCGGLVPLVA